jgi:hypothetical protein
VSVHPRWIGDPARYNRDTRGKTALHTLSHHSSNLATAPPTTRAASPRVLRPGAALNAIVAVVLIGWLATAVLGHAGRGVCPGTTGPLDTHAFDLFHATLADVDPRGSREPTPFDDRPDPQPAAQASPAVPLPLTPQAASRVARIRSPSLRAGLHTAGRDPPLA